MFGSVVSEIDFQFVFHFVDVILGPFLALRLDFLERVELDFVFRGIDEFLLDVVLLGKTVEPERTPNVPNISHHRKGT